MHDAKKKPDVRFQKITTSPNVCLDRNACTRLIRDNDISVYQ